MSTEPQGTDYPTRSSELLWGAGQLPARGPKPGLTLDQIVDAAIAVADTDGFDALSMRRVARELGVGTMSLYRYVPSKVELLDLMLDKVVDCTPQLEQAKGLDWRGVLEVVARGSYQIYLSHPWLMQINWSRPVFGPNILAGVELTIAAFDGLGLTSQQRVLAMIALDSFMTGLARQHIQQVSAAQETGVSDEEFWSQQIPVLELAMATGNYPAMAALNEDAFGGSWEDTFEFGLNCVLDGLEKFIAARSAHP